jgi:gamma-glutamylputrescine oxidase
MVQPSVWEKDIFYNHKDVIIVGSGFVGLWSAYYLKKIKPHWNIVVLERGIIPTGASTRNAGFACFGSVTELMEDARNLGEENMVKLTQLRYEGITRIKKIFAKSNIDLQKNGGYELITAKQFTKAKHLKNDIGWLNILLRKALGQEKIFKLSDDKITKFGFKNVEHLIENKLEAQLHPGKLVQCLLSKVQALGVLVLNGVEVKNFKTTSNAVTVETNLPQLLTTHQLLICTNAFAKELLPDINIEPARGQVLVTSPIKKLSFKGTFHYDEGFYYFRNIGDRILLGGARNIAFEEEKTTAFETTSLIQSELEDLLKEKILPGKKFTIEHRWSGIMGMGKEKMPIVKKISPGIFCAVRMSGMGVALAPVAAENIALLMTK